MTQINYNQISTIYDDVRQADATLITCFLAEVTLQDGANVLDLGCGTGNYTDAFQKMAPVKMHGVEPSAGMRQKAQAKNRHISFKQGHATQIPFTDSYFDFVYLTDVIHHVPNIELMFAELQRVTKPNAKICIVTQSHAQIAARPIVRFFPGTALADQARYPTIKKIIAAATKNGLTWLKTGTLFENDTINLDAHFLTLVKKKGYSMLHLISDEEYARGLQTLETKLNRGHIPATSAGITLVWFVTELV